MFLISVFILLSTLPVYKNGNAWILILLDCVCWHRESNAAGKPGMCACLSISSDRTHKNISGARAGKENLALARCCCFSRKKWLFQRQENYSKCSFNILGTWRGAAGGTSMLISAALWVRAQCVLLCMCTYCRTRCSTVQNRGIDL